MALRAPTRPGGPQGLCEGATEASEGFKEREERLEGRKSAAAPWEEGGKDRSRAARAGPLDAKQEPTSGCSS